MKARLRDVTALVCLLAASGGEASAGEIVVIDPQSGTVTNGDPVQSGIGQARSYAKPAAPGTGPDVVVVAPAAPAPTGPAEVNGEAVELGRARARYYAAPGSASGGVTSSAAVPSSGAGTGQVLVITPETGAPNAPKDTQTINRDALQTSLDRARGYSEGASAPAGGQTVVIVLPDGSTATAAPAPVDAAAALESNTDKARAYSQGRPGCSSSGTSVGTVGNTVVVDRGSSSNSEGVTTVVVGGGCK